VPELRRDPVVGRWVIISTERSRRPSDFPPTPSVPQGAGPCVFCPGQESRTPEEILAVRPPGSAPNGPGWDLRVVPNKFPALRIEGELEPTGDGVYDRMNGIGAHEVIIETPDHGASLAALPVAKVVTVLEAWRQRMVDLQKDPRFEYVSVFKNHGEAAGASLEHPHSQLIATPMVPMMVEQELEGSLRHFRMKKRCIWCDIIHQEMQGKARGLGRLILGEGGFVALCPYAPRFPFETWILPEGHRSSYEDAEGMDSEALARVLGEVLRRMNSVLGDPAWNLSLHSSPLKTPTLDHFHWHIEISPKLTKVAGFEWGTGFFINPTPPEEAARYLRASAPSAV
jgi:UDPglucose--hexose-1-phosphate uridylyltransferase